MLDEAHERSARLDVLLSLVKDAVDANANASQGHFAGKHEDEGSHLSSLRGVLISSATPDLELLKGFVGTFAEVELGES